MSLSNLKIINRTPSRSKIKDALVELPDEVILKIISDYNEQNNLKPIYKNTPENVALLKSEGKVLAPKTEDNFAYLTPNRYGGVEGFNELKEQYDYDEELAPFVEANYTTYEKDLGIQDEYNPDIFNEDWLRENWRKIPFGTKPERLAQLKNIIKQVYNANETNLYNKLKDIYTSFKNDEIKYNQAKEKFFTAFKNNISEDFKELKEEDKSKLRQEATKAYKDLYGEDVEYKDLPNSWKEKLDKYLESGREKKFKEVLKELKGEKEVDKTFEGLKKEFESIFDFRPSKSLIKEFAARNDLKSPDEFFECVEETFKAYQTSKGTKPTFEEAVKYFKTIKAYPTYYKERCREWYDPRTDEEKEADADKEKVGETATNMTISEIESEADIKQMLQAVKNDPTQNAEYEAELKAHRNLLKRGDITADVAKKQMIYVIKHCYEKIVAKRKKNIEDVKNSIRALLDADGKKTFNTVIGSATKEITADKYNLLLNVLQNQLIPALTAEGKKIEDIEDDKMKELFEVVLGINTTGKKIKEALANAIGKEFTAAEAESLRGEGDDEMTGATEAEDSKPVHISNSLKK